MNKIQELFQRLKVIGTWRLQCWYMLKQDVRHRESQTNGKCPYERVRTALLYEK